MIASYIIGIGVIVTLMVLWIGVQAVWRKTFSDYISDDDVLANRTGCSNCGCTTVCRKKSGNFQRNNMYKKDDHMQSTLKIKEYT